MPARPWDCAAFSPVADDPAEHGGQDAPSLQWPRVSHTTPIGGPSARFPTTRWTLILAADADNDRVLLGELMRDYWKPLYVFARRKGLDAEAAKDAVQGLWAQLLERDWLRGLDPERGRLRAFLRTAFARYLHSTHTHDTALKRGGSLAPLTLDFDVAESALSSAPLDPEQAYEREWAVTVMARALERLREEFEAGIRRGPFDVVCAFFGGGPTPSYAEAAAAHGMTIPQLKAFLHRARARFRELVVEAIRPTVGQDGDAEAESRGLLEALRS